MVLVEARCGEGVPRFEWWEAFHSSSFSFPFCSFGVLAMAFMARSSLLSSPRPTPFLPRRFHLQSHASKRGGREKLVITQAIFWQQKKHKKLVESGSSDMIFMKEEVNNPNPKDEARVDELSSTITVSVISLISLVSAEEWDICAIESTGIESMNPFITHAFLSSLEDTGCAVPEEGWLPQHLVARDEAGTILGVVPLYLKSHSYGEFVFDHSWANAYYRFGGSYYPKLQSCVPFTPVTGPRILVRENPMKEQVVNALIKSMTQLAVQFGVSSLHVTFNTAEEWETMASSGFLKRIGMQYHWNNHNYDSFDAFLMDLKQSKRKAIRQERKKVQSQNLKLKRLRGEDIKAHYWDAFYTFYRNTTDNKWGQAYLTRDFFHTMGSRMGDRVLLIIAEDQGEMVAGALNLIGGDTLYGRLWGCLPDVYYPNLHFETCYYQAIEAAIELKLKRVEAGAQGEHKIQRGYLPSITYSSHYIADASFKQVIQNFVKQEASQTSLAMEYLRDSGPFKDQEDR